MSQEILNRNLIFKDKHKNKRCFIIGNGPSINQQDLYPLKDELTFCVSQFYNHPVMKIWHPTYYFFADPILFNEYETNKDVQEYFKPLLSIINSSTFFFPLAGIDVVAKNKLLPMERTYFVNIGGGLEQPYIADIDLTKPIPRIINTMLFPIMSAIYMGCSPIYLMGMDHDFLANQVGEVAHFYRPIKEIKADPLIPHYSYMICMQCQLELWNWYERLLELCNRKEIRILNATCGGYLDMFERTDYPSVLQHTEMHSLNHRPDEKELQDFTQKVKHKYYGGEDRPGALQAVLRAVNGAPDSIGLRILEIELRLASNDLQGARFALINLLERLPASAEASDAEKMSKINEIFSSYIQKNPSDQEMIHAGNRFLRRKEQNPSPPAQQRVNTVCPHCKGKLVISGKGRWNCPICDNIFIANLMPDGQLQSMIVQMGA